MQLKKMKSKYWKMKPKQGTAPLIGDDTHQRLQNSPSPTISGNIISGDVLHFRPNPIGKHKLNLKNRF
jgi:hypothetical protein